MAHVLPKGENINILILDTKIHSNTDQSSKASTASQVTKFESLGKTRHKKDLGSVANCESIKEAAEYPGTLIVMAYSQRIDWGIDTKDMADIQKIAVETVYWKIIVMIHDLRQKGQNPLQLDSLR